jgi:hypothetical protein
MLGGTVFSCHTEEGSSLYTGTFPSNSVLMGCRIPVFETDYNYDGARALASLSSLPSIQLQQKAHLAA